MYVCIIFCKYPKIGQIAFVTFLKVYDHNNSEFTTVYYYDSYV